MLQYHPKVCTCKCVSPIILSVMYFSHWESIAESSQWMIPVLTPLSPLTSKAFGLSLSVPKMYRVTYAIISGKVTISTHLVCSSGSDSEQSELGRLLVLLVATFRLSSDVSFSSLLLSVCWDSFSSKNVLENH